MAATRRALLPLLAVCSVLVSAQLAASGQNSDARSLVETGTKLVDGKQVAYRVRNLPVGSFPDLPPAIAQSLTARNCLIPQTYEAHRPENVVAASLERPGSADWAVLCNAQGKVSLLVFLGSQPAAEPLNLISFALTDRLQVHDSAGELGFNWGIDPASPRRVHEAQAAMAHRPPAPDHDCLADSVVDGKTIYHLYRNGVWETVATD
jgi:hypothetical protein